MTGALRREQMVEISIKQLEAEIEQLNRLVNCFHLYKLVDIGCVLSLPGQIG